MCRMGNDSSSLNGYPKRSYASVDTSTMKKGGGYFVAAIMRRRKNRRRFESLKRRSKSADTLDASSVGAREDSLMAIYAATTAAAADGNRADEDSLNSDSISSPATNAKNFRAAKSQHPTIVISSQNSSAQNSPPINGDARAHQQQLRFADSVTANANKTTGYVKNSKKLSLLTTAATPTSTMTFGGGGGGTEHYLDELAENYSGGEDTPPGGARRPRRKCGSPLAVKAAAAKNGARKNSFFEGLNASTLLSSSASTTTMMRNGGGGVNDGCGATASSSSSAAMMLAQNGKNRGRSRSLCVQQLKADCQVVTASVQHQQIQQLQQQHQQQSSARKSSANSLMPMLARLRIQQCFKNAKPIIGQQILKRACSLRSELKTFLCYLSDEKVDELANDIYVFVGECVTNVEEPERVGELSRAFGEMHAQLCNLGFRPEFFSAIADATIAECVRLDGGAHKRCETLLAWSQLMQFMFSNVRDGYYAQVRQQRRSSLPQQKLQKQFSTATSLQKKTFDMAL